MTSISKNTKIILLVVIIALLAGGTAYYFKQKAAKKKEAEQTQEEPPQEPAKVDTKLSVLHQKADETTSKKTLEVAGMDKPKTA